MREVRRLGRRPGDVAAAGDDRPGLGVLGGSFNPPHVGHLIVASDACAQLGLERVLFVPAAAPPHKHVADDVPADVRLEMTRCAVAGDPRFAVSAIEIDAATLHASTRSRRCGGATPATVSTSSSGRTRCCSSRPGTSAGRSRGVPAGRGAAARRRRGGDRRGRGAWGGRRVVLLDNAAIDVSSSCCASACAAGRRYATS